MESTGYVTLTRQSGLARELQAVANNIANAATTGFKSEGVMFSEYVQPVTVGPSLSMGQGNVRMTSFDQGGLNPTGAAFDFAIEGDGYFLIQTPLGERLSRNGAFAPNADGQLVTNDGYPVLDSGGAPVFIPPGEQVAVAADGTLSVNGQPIGQMGIVAPAQPQDLVREDGVMFRTDTGFAPAENARVMQGFLENSNVNAIGQLARLIEVQRAYEMGQSFLESEDERVRMAMKALLS